MLGGIVEGALDDALHLGGHFGGDGAAAEHLLAAQQFQRFRHDDGAAGVDDAVGQTSGHRIGDDAGRTVGAAAFHAEDEFAPRHGFGAQAARIVKHLDGGLSGAIRHFHGAALIFDGEAHHGLAALRDLAGNVFGGLIFQSHDDDAVHVGMQGGIDGEEVVQGKVFVHFAAAEPGAKRHATLHQRAYAPHRRIGVVHRSDDGDMVADAETAIGTPVTHDFWQHDSVPYSFTVWRPLTTLCT